MSNELKAVAPSGTLYARIMNSSGQAWNTSSSAFETYASGNYADYDIPLTEQGSSNVYTGDFPTAITSSGVYSYFVYRQSGGSPAEGDLVISVGSVDWTGSAPAASASGAMSGSDFRDYILRLGFKRTDKDTEIYEAITDAIKEFYRRFGFDEGGQETTTTDTISTLGDFKISDESDFGRLVGVVMEDGTNAHVLEIVSKERFDRLYPDINVTNDRGYPEHATIYAGSIYIGPIPDSTGYSYRKTYYTSGETVTASTSSVPFTGLYRDVLADNVLGRLYRGLEEYQRAEYHEQKFEKGFLFSKRRERKNSGKGFFMVQPLNI